MAKKVFEVQIDVTNMTWETCYTYVEAETAEEAKKLFKDNPFDYDWDGWEHQESEMRDWEVNSVEYDDFMTKRLQEEEQLNNITNKMSHEDMDD